MFSAETVERNGTQFPCHYTFPISQIAFEIVAQK